jgi:hypothetical protein
VEGRFMKVSETLEKMSDEPQENVAPMSEHMVNALLTM